MTDHVKSIVDNLPFNPGIYMMRDENGKIIYVGKAISLRKRVRQYFQKNNKSQRIEKMVSLIRDISFIVTENEVEALVLECNYIKENRPKFNVMLKDDKTYPYIKINIKSKYPTITVTRKKVDDKAMYFGPYTNVGAMRDALNSIKEIFPVKRCRYNLDKKKIDRPCLYYHIGRCLGPCINDISLNEYRDMINQIVLFLQGKNSDIKDLIKLEMDKCIGELEFEKAAKLKKRLDDIEKISLKQKVGNLNENSTDIFGYVHNLNSLYVQVFKIRNYKVVLHDNVILHDISKDEINESLVSIVSNYYLENKDIPQKVYIKLEDKELQLLNSFFYGKEIKLNIICPKKGDKAKLVNMVENNIHINIEDRKNNVIGELSEILGLSNEINSIESFDISNLKNEYIVGCMIRYDEKKLNKKMYRRFKIKSTDTQDDPKCMYEVISRRLKHKEDWPIPDAFFIDGGKAQISAVKKALKDSKEEDILVYGMIKNDKHRTRGLIDKRGREIDLSDNKNILNFLTFLQDEVHRYTIAYHRKLRDSIK